MERTSFGPRFALTLPLILLAGLAGAQSAPPTSISSRPSAPAGCPQAIAVFVSGEVRLNGASLSPWDTLGEGDALALGPGAVLETVGSGDNDILQFAGPAQIRWSPEAASLASSREPVAPAVAAAAAGLLRWVSWSEDAQECAGEKCRDGFDLRIERPLDEGERAELDRIRAVAVSLGDKKRGDVLGDVLLVSELLAAEQFKEADRVLSAAEGRCPKCPALARLRAKLSPPPR